MVKRTVGTIAAACGGVAVFAMALLGVDGAEAPRVTADPSTTVEPTPSSPDECCDTSQPQASEWKCKIGLNCGKITPRRTAPPAEPPPPNPPPP
ncbi:hypothetical protein [Mycobacterium sp. 94-17]|uniref:hypothetical protein n=1 Tax=Mycobacterium sp. 94-17 TaxID=2986147 RepID=UPI002D1E7628|nr:hypothetical protein [Mycobacterium sp. 94-17]MEB4210476.1 hypothetical protein [Mycobacterium sp. 94-17]